MVLSFLGETINIMTLGGLALAVGILVMTPRLRSKTLSGIRRGHTQREPSWKRGANRGSRSGIHALYLHRVLADVLLRVWPAISLFLSPKLFVRHAGVIYLVRTLVPRCDVTC